MGNAAPVMVGTRIGNELFGGHYLPRWLTRTATAEKQAATLTESRD